MTMCASHKSREQITRGKETTKELLEGSSERIRNELRNIQEKGDYCKLLTFHRLMLLIEKDLLYTDL
jgi:hypothetical protein